MASRSSTDVQYYLRKSSTRGRHTSHGSTLAPISQRLDGHHRALQSVVFFLFIAMGLVLRFA